MAIAAAAAQVHMHLSPPPPPLRRTVPWLSCTFHAWTAVVCLALASMWVFVLGMATFEIGWLACGARCAVITAAANVFSVAVAILAVLFPFSLLGSWMMACAQAAAVVPVAASVGAAATDIEAAKAPALTLKTFYAGIRRELRDPVVLWFLASITFGLLMVIAVLVDGDKPVMGSPRDITCRVIYHVAAAGMNAVDCFALCPLITLRVWRSWRKARRVL